MSDRSNTPNEQLAMLWVKAQPLVWAYVQSTVVDYQHAEDVLQQVAQQTAAKFDQYDPARQFQAWAIGIAKNKIREYLRKQSRERLVLSPEAVEAVGATFGEQSEYLAGVRGVLRRCLAKLSQRARDLLHQRYALNRKPMEIAAELGVSANTARIRLHRHRNSLAQCVRRSMSQEEQRR